MLRRRELAGACVLALSLGAAAGGVAPAAALLHPLAGTALVLLADAALERRRGASPLSAEPQALVWMATLSVFIWVAIEALNDRRGLWAYLGWPSDDLLRYAALGWTFATILPFIALTAELLVGDSAWESRASAARARVVAALAGLVVYGMAVRGPAPGDNLWWMAAGVAGLFLAGGGAGQSVRRLVGWAVAGVFWITVSELINRFAAGERLVISPDGFAPVLWPAALLLGPALGGLYQEAAGRLGLAPWPPSERSSTFDTILS